MKLQRRNDGKICNLRTGETEAGKWEVPFQPERHSETLSQKEKERRNKWVGRKEVNTKKES